MRGPKCPRCGSAEIILLQFKSNHSAFNGYRWRRSDYSAIQCGSCSYVWRSKAAWIAGLPIIPHQGVRS